MSARLVVPSALRDSAGGAREVAVEGATLRDVFDDLSRRMPMLERRIRDERGLLRPHVLVFVDGVMVRSADDMDTPVRDGTEVHVAPAVSGGCIQPLPAQAPRTDNCAGQPKELMHARR